MDDTVQRPALHRPPKPEEPSRAEQSFTVDDAIDQIGVQHPPQQCLLSCRLAGWGKFQTRLAALSGSSMLCLSMQLLLHSFNVPVLKRDWKLSETAASQPRFRCVS